MAKHFLLLVLALFSTFLLLATESQAYSRTTPFHQGHKPEKLTHLHFYFHDIITGDKPTAIRVTKPAKINATTRLFGVVVVADNPLTEGPEPSSKKVGRAQGVYASTDMNIVGFTMLFNLAFTEGEFNGSTLAMYGRNPIMSKVREMPIIGGTGAFRLARGYAQAKTYMFAGLDAIVEYNVFIWH